MLKIAIFRNPFLLCRASFCLLRKMLLVSHIQTAFARCKRSGYVRLGRTDFPHQVRAAKNVFGSHPVWKASLFKERSLLMPNAFAFHLFFPKRKAFADIHKNVGLVRSVVIRQRRISNCNKPVITWPLGRLVNLSPSGASRPRGHVITSTCTIVQYINNTCCRRNVVHNY